MHHTHVNPMHFTLRTSSYNIARIILLYAYLKWTTRNVASECTEVSKWYAFMAFPAFPVHIIKHGCFSRSFPQETVPTQCQM